MNVDYAIGAAITEHLCKACWLELICHHEIEEGLATGAMCFIVCCFIRRALAGDIVYPIVAYAPLRRDYSAWNAFYTRYEVTARC